MTIVLHVSRVCTPYIIVLRVIVEFDGLYNILFFFFFFFHLNFSFYSQTIESTFDRRNRHGAGFSWIFTDP